MADIGLTSHSEIADVFGREARMESGDRSAFIDPKALPAIVAEAKRAFVVELAKARRTQ